MGPTLNTDVKYVYIQVARMVCVVTGEVAVVGVTTAVSRVPAPHPQFSQQPDTTQERGERGSVG